MLLLYMDIGVTIIPAHSVLCHCSSSIVCIYLLLSKCVEIKGWKLSGEEEQVRKVIVGPVAVFTYDDIAFQRQPCIARDDWWLVMHVVSKWIGGASRCIAAPTMNVFNTMGHVCVHRTACDLVGICQLANSMVTRVTWSIAWSITWRFLMEILYLPSSNVHEKKHLLDAWYIFYTYV